MTSTERGSMGYALSNCLAMFGDRETAEVFAEHIRGESNFTIEVREMGLHSTTEEASLDGPVYVVVDVEEGGYFTPKTVMKEFRDFYAT